MLACGGGGRGETKALPLQAQQLNTFFSKRAKGEGPTTCTASRSSCFIIGQHCDGCANMLMLGFSDSSSSIGSSPNVPRRKLTNGPPWSALQRPMMLPECTRTGSVVTRRPFTRVPAKQRFRKVKPKSSKRISKCSSCTICRLASSGSNASQSSGGWCVLPTCSSALEQLASRARVPWGRRSSAGRARQREKVQTKEKGGGSP
mmetsp:Transcript_30875/g.78176  ORF Transcript_30875/g.78176 Transcript_30875/m.78176 type:complete len:203 (-) Transcript_30875:1311-1919(-)